MKRLLILFAALAIALPTIHAQKEVKEGSMKIDIKFEAKNEDDPNMAMAQQAMEGSSINVYFNKEKSFLVKAFMMGGMMNVTMLNDAKAKKMTTLMDMMGQKMANVKEVEDTEEETEVTGEMPKFKHFRDDTKEIAGYKCHRVELDEEEMEMEGGTVSFFITEDLAISRDLFKDLDQSLDPGILGGFPLGIVVDQKDMKLTLMAKEFSTKVDQNVFQVSTEGYQMMTPEQMQQMLGGMGGFGQ